MNILVIGSGGREHAFCYQLAKSKHRPQLFILPGNPGTALLGTNVPIAVNNFAEIGKFCIAQQVDLVIVGPEDPLVNGIRDYFEADAALKKTGFIGPGAKGAQMEGSKDWSKVFMKRYNIPTAAYKTFTRDNLDEGIAYIRDHALPVVLKADGLAAGKGVLICETHDDALSELRMMISDSKFGTAGTKVVIEQFLKGIELSVFVLTDGSSYKILPSAKDYKRIGEGETGLNTGGMGAISPVPFAGADFMQKVEERIIKPTMDGLHKEGIHYTGFIFIGLMNVGGDPYVIEYNCRMGDPETEAVLPLIKTDFADLMIATANGTLDKMPLHIDTRSAATIVLVSKGYPGSFEKGSVITGTSANNSNDAGSILFHSGTRINEQEQLVTNGGRVLAITSLGDTLKDALHMSRATADAIAYDTKYFRRDIGFEFDEK